MSAICLLGPAGQAHIIERLVVDREEAAGRAIFGRHVGDRRPVGDRQSRDAGAEELDEAPDHALGAQHLGDGEDEVGGGDPLLQRAGQMEADHFGDDHRDRLAEHRRLGLDPADAPAEHAEAVDHGGVAVGADQRVGIGDLLRARGGPAVAALAPVGRVDPRGGAPVRAGAAVAPRRPLRACSRRRGRYIRD